MKTLLEAKPQTYTGPEPTNFADLLRILAANITHDWDDTGSAAIVVGTTAPTDLTATWFVKDATGRPLGMKRYSLGAWRFVYPGPGDHDLVYFAGNWASFFDTAGKGLAGGAWEGYCLCLGNYGTPNLFNRFLVAGYRSDGQAHWVTKISGADAYNGGANDVLIQIANLPTITFPIKVQQGFKGSGQGQPAGVPLASTDTWAGSGGAAAANATGGYLGAQGAISLLPPYVALGVAMWIGY